jgi:hypothetical protein
MKLLKDLGTNPKTDLYPKLLQRYSEALSTDTKIAFLDFFSACKNIPQNVIDTVYTDASSDLLEKRLENALLSCLGNIGKKREGLFLLKKLDGDDAFMKGIIADSISRMKVPELGAELLKRLEESEKNEDKYLQPEIKSKLILFFGENKSREAIGYLQKIVTDKSSDKYMKMYAMVSLLKIGDASSIRLIAANLSNEDVKIKEYASYSLSLFKNAETIPYLRSMLLDNDAIIRVYGCQGIALNEDYESIKAVLYKLKNDPEISVRNEALVTLVNLGSKGIDVTKETFKGKKIPEGMLAYLSDSIAKKPSTSSVGYLVELFNNGDKKDKDVIVKYLYNATSNLLDPLVLSFLNSTDHVHRIIGIKIAYQIEQCSLWGKINDIANNDSVKMVKDNAKKIIDMKK